MPSSLNFAVDFAPRASLPLFGSVNPYAPAHSPVISLGIYFCFCSGVPKYKIGNVNISNNWNSKADNPRDFGGFNYCSEECILRWLHRGDTIYDVDIPEDADVVQLEKSTTIYRTNKIIIKNPRKVDDDLALRFYEISKIPEKYIFERG